jgi:hypothetical protein
MKAMKIFFLKVKCNSKFARLSIHLTFVAMLVFSCRQAPVEKKEKEFQQELVCREINLEKEFYIPLEIDFIDGRFFIPDFHGDKMLNEIEIGSYKSVGSFGLRGQGPGEFLGPLSTWIYENRLFVFDRRGFKVVFFDIMKPNPTSFYYFSELFQLDYSVSKLVSVDNNNYLAAGYFAGGRYAILDSIGKITKYFGSFPDFIEGEEKTPYDAKAMFHQVKFVANYEINKMAAVSSHVLDIIDLSGKHPVILSRFKLAEYDYDYQSGAVIMTNLKKGFAKGAKSITSSKNKIFILFNPNGEGDIEKNSLTDYEIIVFNWDGKLISRYKTNCELALIKFIENKGFYGFTESLEFVHLEY